MIKLFLYENPGKLNEYFQEGDFNIPFLGNTLFDFIISNYKKLADSLNSELEVFIPEYFGDIFVENGIKTYKNIPQNISTEKRDLVFISNVFSIPVWDFTTDDCVFLKQNPDEFFSHSSGLKCGFISSSSNFSITTKSLDAFNNLILLNEKNFLTVNQKLINFFRGNSFPGFYGEPVIMTNSENIFNSRVCGPCFIGQDVRVLNSTIYPGTILTGSTVVQNSEIFESFLCQATVKNSAVKNSLIVLSNLEDVNLKNSIAPSGSNIVYDRNR
jgi:hypothetical protein